MNQKLFEYIENSPTAYHATAYTASILEEQGYTLLSESEEWKLEERHGYYVTRNGSSLVAFRCPAADFSGFMMTASHSDSPCLKIKENAELADSNFVKLSTEKYGGMLCSTWMDRPLSVAGRVAIRTEQGIVMKNVDLKQPCAIIPSVAIHMNRNANDNASYNAAVDMLPLYGEVSHKDTFMARIAEAVGAAKDAILSTDLFVYNPQQGTEWNQFISAPRLDDLQCAFAALTAFIGAETHSAVMPVYCLFDNEEVGSQTKQGAASTFLYDVLTRITDAFGFDAASYRRKVASSFLVSCDNAHSIHPNHPEHADKNHTVRMNGGVVIKYNANQKYTSDAVSVSIFKLICDRAGVPVQLYANRADMPGGSTLGNIANTQVSLNTIDVGNAQLAMHSSYETAGAKDTVFMISALKKYYESQIVMTADGDYKIF